MSRIELPAPLQSEGASNASYTRQITIIGGNGAGKSRFMDEMMSLNGERSYCLNALSAFYPEREESTMPGSIDRQYREAIRQRSYMRTDAVSELDKLLYMLFADEMLSLLEMKEQALKQGKRFKVKPTKIDIIKKNWERIFPGNKIMRDNGVLKFATRAGEDLISPQSLSQGEKTVLYYLGAVLYACHDAVIFIDSPSLFVHPTILGNLWNTIEELRPDCTFVYNSVDVDFVNTRTHNTYIWVKSYSSEQHKWDYGVLSSDSLTEELLVQFAGSRRPVLFIEGDESHSIDRRLYGLVFPEMTVKPVGSCDKVIETTRSFNDQQTFHHLQSFGIVDRDRRTDQEVFYLRKKHIMVPDVAEIENIFLLPGVIKLMASRRGRDGEKIFQTVKHDIIRMFRKKADEQALQHVRHKMKRMVECKIDARFTCITALELHLQHLGEKLEPRKHYNILREQFAALIRDNDYEGILRVFNHKPMLPNCEVHAMLGYNNKNEYIGGVLDALKSNGKDSETLRRIIRHCLRADESEEEGHDITEQTRKLSNIEPSTKE